MKQRFNSHRSSSGRSQAPLISLVRRLSNNRLTEEQATYVLWGVIVVCLGLTLFVLLSTSSDQPTELESPAEFEPGVTGP